MQPATCERGEQVGLDSRPKCGHSARLPQAGILFGVELVENRTDYCCVSLVSVLTAASGITAVAPARLPRMTPSRWASVVPSPALVGLTSIARVWRYSARGEFAQPNPTRAVAPTIIQQHAKRMRRSKAESEVLLGTKYWHRTAAESRVPLEFSDVGFAAVWRPEPSDA